MPNRLRWPLSAGLAIVAVAFGLWQGGRQRLMAADGALPIDPKIDRFIKTCETNRRGAILRLEFELRGLRSAERQDGQTQARIRTLETDLARLESSKHLLVPTLAFPPEKGSIGRLPRLACYVDQILGEKELLARVYFPVKVAATQRFRPQGQLVMPAVTFFVRGVGTADMHEGAMREMTQVFEITGKKTYRTTDGRSASAWVLELFDLDAAEDQWRHDSAQPR
jgi:hypothetical protein